MIPLAPLGLKIPQDRFSFDNYIPSNTLLAYLSSAVALWASWKILQALERRKKKFRLRGIKDREIHVINTAEEWETFWPLLKQSCEKIKVKRLFYFFLSLVQLRV